MKLDDLDLAWCVRRLPKEIRSMLEKNEGVVSVAGGFVRSCIAREDVNDIDLFTTSKELAEKLAKGLTEGKDRRVLETDNAYTVLGITPVCQFIHRWTYEKPKQVVESFDFTVCAAGIWFDGKAWTSACDERFYTDLAAKRLVYRNPVREEAPGGSLLRVLKYYQRGYRITLPSLAAILGRVHEAVRDGEGEGLDAATILLGILREVDPLIGIPIADAAEPL